MFNNTDLEVFHVIHKLIEHPKWTLIDPHVIKAYTWLMYMTNTQESVIHDLPDKALSAATGLSEDYIGTKLRTAFADLGLVGWVKNQRGKGYRYFVLDPDTGAVIDPSPYNPAKLTVEQIRRYYRTTLEHLGVVVNSTDKVRNGQRLLVSQCPICRRVQGKLHFEVRLEEQGQWMCHDCSRYGNMLEFEQFFHQQRGKTLFIKQAAVKLARHLKRLDKLDKLKEVAVPLPITNDEIQAAMAGV